MHHLEAMLDKHPAIAAMIERELLVDCLQGCAECAQVNHLCADACLNEPKLAGLRRCIRLNQDCADLCTATAALLCRQTEPDWNLLRRQLEVCAFACRICGEECRRHASLHEHCKLCAETCSQTEQVCRTVWEALAYAV